MQPQKGTKHNLKYDFAVVVVVKGNSQMIAQGEMELNSTGGYESEEGNRKHFKAEMEFKPSFKR